MTDLISRLRDTPNWMRESYGSWKDCVLKYDRAPFEAADEIEKLRAALNDIAQHQDSEWPLRCRMPMEQARALAASEAAPDWYARGQDWGLADALTNGQSGDCPRRHRASVCGWRRSQDDDESGNFDGP